MVKKTTVAAAIAWFAAVAIQPARAEDYLIGTPYNHATIAEVMADGSLDIGRKVIMSGYVLSKDGDAAILTAKPDDYDGIVVDIRTAPNPLRLQIFQQCNNSLYRCHIVFNATVMAAVRGGGVYVRAD